MKNKQLIGIAATVLLLVAFGTWRYENFASSYNALEFGRYNAMFMLVSIGMALSMFVR